MRDVKSIHQQVAIHKRPAFIHRPNKKEPSWSHPRSFLSQCHHKKKSLLPMFGFIISLDWLKRKFTGKPYNYWENLWFPVNFPIIQFYDYCECLTQWVKLPGASARKICQKLANIALLGPARKQARIHLHALEGVLQCSQVT